MSAQSYLPLDPQQPHHPHQAHTIPPRIFHQLPPVIRAMGSGLSPDLDMGCSPTPSPIPSPSMKSFKSEHVQNSTFANYSTQLPPLRVHLSQQQLQISMAQKSCGTTLPAMDELPSLSVHASYPTTTNDSESLPGLPSLFSFPATAPAISAPLSVALQHESHNIPSPVPSLKRQSAEPVSINPPAGPRKRGRKSKQDLLNRVALTPEEKKANHMVAEQRRRALVRSSLHELSMLVGMKPPIEGDGSSVGSADGSSRVEILEGGKFFIEALVRRNAILRELVRRQ
ncbi:hypothetical protein HDU81_004591 [Chytriomyces hyalinus]|nr:hypothetical protein HDU81_004591 [Chytriomyces hyalinus]